MTNIYIRRRIYDSLVFFTDYYGMEDVVDVVNEVLDKYVKQLESLRSEIIKRIANGEEVIPAEEFKKKKLKVVLE